jgi:hypothetical protein
MRDPSSDNDFSLIDNYIQAQRQELIGAELLGVLVNDNYVGYRVFQVQYLSPKSEEISIVMVELNILGRNIDIINSLDGLVLQPINTTSDDTSKSSSDIQSNNYALPGVVTSQINSLTSINDM